MTHKTRENIKDFAATAVVMLSILMPVVVLAELLVRAIGGSE